MDEPIYNLVDVVVTTAFSPEFAQESINWNQANTLTMLLVAETIPVGAQEHSRGFASGIAADIISLRHPGALW